MLSLIIGSIFLSNILVTNYLGIKIDKDSKIVLSLLTALITFITSMVNYLIYNILNRYGFTYLKNLTFILTIIIISSLVLMIYKFIVDNDEDLLPKVVNNTLILGLSLIIISTNYDYTKVLIYSISTCIGYIVIMFLIHYLNEELNKRKVPLSFKGYPIILITLGILLMVLSRL